eukprot:m.149402 g.149402  ORF g.149402 m.149402 type:complete len:326 (-) comp30655_c0_seq1:286-1263(-)
MSSTVRVPNPTVSSTVQVPNPAQQSPLRLIVSTSGETVSLECNKIAEAASYHFSWASGDSSWSAIGETKYDSSANRRGACLKPGTYTCKVFYETKAGARSPAVQSKPITVAVLKIPAAVSASLHGDKVLLRTQPVDVAVQYTWRCTSIGSTWAQSTTSNTVSVHMPPGTYTFTVSYLTASGAVSPDAPSDNNNITPARMSSQQSSDRTARLDGNVKVLYHQTTHDIAQAILYERKMLRGSAGLAGGGIYFATSTQDTFHKAHRHGTILRVRVRLGNVKTVPFNGDTSVTFQRLLDQQFDSVMIPRHNGIEYVVYNWDQATPIDTV